MLTLSHAHKETGVFFLSEIIPSLVFSPSHSFILLCHVHDKPRGVHVHYVWVDAAHIRCLKPAAARGLSAFTD